ncbi:SpoIIE family protein phosphatase [Streptomyces sp. NPDC088801]|uniref:SpoIIE family protein phosphatase n=1 Tax=Streptomyces sp. NPDC088801 TaxID=3365903 RepID=UPI0037FD2832
MRGETAGPAGDREQPDRLRTGSAADAGADAWGEDTQDGATLALVVRLATTCLGGTGALVHRHDRAVGRLRLVAATGLSPESERTWADLPDEQDVAPAQALEHGRFVCGAGGRPGVASEACTAIPIPGTEGPIGVLTVLTVEPGEPDEAQRSLLHTLAGWAGARLGGGTGSSTVSGQPTGAERSVQMGELTAALAEAVTSRDVVEAVAAYVLPPFGADGLVFQILEGGRLHVVGSAGYPREFIGLLDGMPLAAHLPVRDVLRTRTPRFIEAKAEISRRYPTMQGINEASPKEAVVFLPMIASGRAVGLCVVSFSRPRSFSNEERTLLTTLSGLVGQSLERARLYDVEHARARELQRGLLPRTLPRLPAARAAARYLPAGRGEQVGGDWYDLIALSADRVAMVIGDVMGHGIAEAATMGRLRTAVRTLADLEIPPDELFSRLNDLVSDLGEDFYATCLYAVFDPVARTCTYSLAGHPPPVIVHPDGTVHSPDVTPDPPLGAARPPFETRQLHLPDESLLVLYTDGLVESATRDADEGLAQLRQLLSRTAAGTVCFGAADVDADIRCLEELCDTVVSGLLPDHETTTDDAGLLVVHARCTAAHDVASLDLPNDPRAAGQARAYVREQLGAWGLGDLALTTELLVSELVGNVVRHAKDPVRLRMLRSRSLICEVYDGSLTTPRIRHASYTDEGGRGLQLVAALSRRWGARYLHDGKCIWTEQDLEPDQAAGVLGGPGASSAVTDGQWDGGTFPFA